MTAVSLLDVETLTRDPSPTSRVDTATKLARGFDDGAFSAGEVELVLQIFRMMVKDTEVRVRQAMSDALRANPWLPHDIATALASDVADVAAPVLEYSPVLTAADLLDIIAQQRDVVKMRAIAARPLVQEEVVDALVDHGDESVAAMVVANNFAIFRENAFNRVIDRFGHAANVNEPLAARADLPARIVERLLTVVSDQVRQQISARHRHAADEVIEMTLATRERATLELARGFSDVGLAALISQLKNAGKLTPTLLLRAVCMGNTGFFLSALVAQSGVTTAAAAGQLRERSGLEDLWQRAKMPAEMLPAIDAALTAVREVEAAAEGLTGDAFSRRVLEQAMTARGAKAADFQNADLEYLLTKLAKAE
jgi:uncharacterized protein (DUF2336 family)